MTRQTDISCRTILDRVLFEIRLSMRGSLSTNLLARKLETKAALLQPQLREFELAGRIRYNADKDGWEPVP
jgi:hypothetical protein